MSHLKINQRRFLLVSAFLCILSLYSTEGLATSPTSPQESAKTASPKLALPMMPTDGQGIFGVISDIHFDPFYDPSLVDKLVASPVSKWHTIFMTSSILTPSPSGQDTNFPLFDTTLKSISAYAPVADYLLLPGDLLSHNFRKDYESTATDKSSASYRQFVLKTTHFVLHELKAKFPHTPIIVTLGNNDSFCGDYKIEPGAEYLYDTEHEIAKMAGITTLPSSYPEIGAYLIPHPRTPRQYFVVFDNIFLSKKYTNACGTNVGDPSQATLLWLKSTLYHLKRTGAKATLVIHAPSGIDAYSSTDACNNGGSSALYLTPESNGEFLDLVQQYHAQITAIFSGHSHMDDYRVFIDPQGEAIAYQRIIPSISPVFGNNPGYQIYSYERKNGTPSDFLTLTYAQRSEGSPQSWQVEYDFRRTYNLSELDAANLQDLSDEISTDQSTRDIYIQHYAGGATSSPITQDNWQAYTCALTNLDNNAFQHCFCGGTK